MSDISSTARLAPAAAQLPVNWYFDANIFALEKKLLFDAGPGYVGHELMVPEPARCEQDVQCRRVLLSGTPRAFRA
jgi:hypothetical protein